MKVKSILLKMTNKKYFYEDFLKALRDESLDYYTVSLSSEVKNIIYNRIIYHNEMNKDGLHPELSLDSVWCDNTKWYKERNLYISKLLPCDKSGYVITGREEELFYIGSKSFYICRWLVEHDV